MGRRARRREETAERLMSERLASVSLLHFNDGAPLSEGRVQLAARTRSQADLISAIQKSDIVFVIGPAGTGKTFIAVSMALSLVSTGLVKKIVLTRPAIEAHGERIGYLPGTLNEKMDPFVQPLYDVLFTRIGRAAVSRMLRNGMIEIAPLAFMRGRTFSDSIIVMDEAQNATLDQLKMAMTRIGDNSRMIIAGDPDQSDLDERRGGLLSAAERMADAPGVRTVRFSSGEVVRSRIVSEVLRRL